MINQSMLQTLRAGLEGAYPLSDFCISDCTLYELLAALETLARYVVAVEEPHVRANPGGNFPDYALARAILGEEE